MWGDTEEEKALGSEEIEWFKMKTALTTAQILYKTSPSLFSVNEVCSAALSISCLLLSAVWISLQTRLK